MPPGQAVPSIDAGRGRGPGNGRWRTHGLLQQIRRGQAPDPAVYAGDIVVVDGSRVKETQKRILSNIPILSIFRPF